MQLSSSVAEELTCCHNLVQPDSTWGGTIIGTINVIGRQPKCFVSLIEDNLNIFVNGIKIKNNDNAT